MHQAKNSNPYSPTQIENAFFMVAIPLQSMHCFCATPPTSAYPQHWNWKAEDPGFPSLSYLTEPSSQHLTSLYIHVTPALLQSRENPSGNREQHTCIFEVAAHQHHQHRPSVY